MSPGIGPLMKLWPNHALQRNAPAAVRHGLRRPPQLPSLKVRHFPFALMKSTLIVFASLTLLAHAEAQQDNRTKPRLKAGELIADHDEEVLLTAPALRAKIASFDNDALTHSVEERLTELKWQRRIALRDADYILCLFDSSMHAEPGNNPRVLILFTPDYQLKTWGRFTCEPGFEYGCVVSPLGQPHTYFVTINPSSRHGGTLFFEKYLIEAGGIRKLGQGSEIAKIPDAQ